MSLVQVAEGWYNFVTAPDKLQPIIKERLEVCDTCDHKVTINPVVKGIVLAVNEHASVYACGLCNCPLAALSTTAQPLCRAGKWAR